MEPSELIDAKLAEIGKIATAGYFIAVRIRGTAPLMVFKTYPQAWIDRYTEKGYVLRDPITTWAMTIGGSIRWSSPFLPDPFRVLAQAAEYGLTYGASIAHGPLRALTICSVARSDREFTDEEISRIQQIAIALHDLIALPKLLTDAQKEILQAITWGANMAKVAGTLGVSEATARARVKTVCAELFAQTPDEAVQRARDHKLL